MENLDLKYLGLVIKRQREKKNITQEELADKAGFDRTYISMLERGKRNLSFLNLIKLAIGLDMTLHKLIGEYDELKARKSKT